MIMCNMFIWSCGNLPAGPPQVGFSLMGSSKELGIVPWWFSGLKAAAWMFSEKALGSNFGRQMRLKYRDDSTSLRMAGGAMLQRIGSHSVFVGLRVPDTVLIMVFN